MKLWSIIWWYMPCYDTSWWWCDDTCYPFYDNAIYDADVLLHSMILDEHTILMMHFHALWWTLGDDDDDNAYPMMTMLFEDTLWWCMSDVQRIITYSVSVVYLMYLNNVWQWNELLLYKDDLQWSKSRDYQQQKVQGLVFDRSTGPAVFYFRVVGWC